jgi:hypothetical protein
MKIESTRVLGISLSRLARLSGVSRFKICLFKLVNGFLTSEEQNQIRVALQTQTDRRRCLRYSTADLATSVDQSPAALGQAA